MLLPEPEFISSCLSCTAVRGGEHVLDGKSDAGNKGCGPGKHRHARRKLSTCTPLPLPLYLRRIYPNMHHRQQQPTAAGSPVTTPRHKVTTS